MNCLTIAIRVRKDIAKNVEQTLKFRLSTSQPPPDDDEYAHIIKCATERRMSALTDEMILANEISQKFSDIIGKVKKQWLFITIRPSQSTSWSNFKKISDKYLSSKRFEDGSYSYEQTGTTHETVGTGFHVHIVADTTWRSKAECLRDTITAFKNICEPNCIKILPTKNPHKLIDEYLVNYHSDDDHKEPHLHWDTIWRNSLALPSLHKLPLSST